MSEVKLRIPTDSLRNLPTGATYDARSGQAHVKVGRTAGTATEPEVIYIDASCDSLQLLCEQYQKTIRSLKEEMRHQEESHWQEQVASGTPFKIFLAGLASGTLLTIISIVLIKTKK